MITMSDVSTTPTTAPDTAATDATTTRPTAPAGSGPVTQPEGATATATATALATDDARLPEPAPQVADPDRAVTQGFFAGSAAVDEAIELVRDRFQKLDRADRLAFATRLSATTLLFDVENLRSEQEAPSLSSAKRRSISESKKAWAEKSGAMPASASRNWRVVQLLGEPTAPRGVDVDKQWNDAEAECSREIEKLLLTGCVPREVVEFLAQKAARVRCIKADDQAYGPRRFMLDGLRFFCSRQGNIKTWARQTFARLHPAQTELPAKSRFLVLADTVDNRAVHVNGLIPKSQGAMISAALHRIARGLISEDRSQGRPVRHIGQALVDALELAVRMYASRPTSAIGAAGYPSAVVTIPISLLYDAQGGHAHTNFGTSVPTHQLQDLLKDCKEIFLAITGDDDLPINLIRTERFATLDQRIALAAKFRTCVVPGCSVPTGCCEIHHLHDWAKGGNTNLDNLVPLCAIHHAMVTRGDLTLTPHFGSGTIIVTDLAGVSRINTTAYINYDRATEAALSLPLGKFSLTGDRVSLPDDQTKAP